MDACTPLDVTVIAAEAPPSQYAEFCGRMPGECALSGDPSIRLDSETVATLARVNREVNAEIVSIADAGCSGAEELWSRPLDGFGDCEDFALEKRARLRDAGLPTAAMTMAIVHHRTRFFAHAVLLIETDGGTFVLDNLSDDIACWREAPYVYDRRERPDGLWERFER